MNVPALLLNLRKRDRDIAEAMGIKVAQLNRWQKKIQEPSDESQIKIREYVLDHISWLQKFLNGEQEKTTSVEEVAIEKSVQESEAEIDKVEESEVEVGQEPVKKPKITKKSLGKWKSKK